MAIAPFPHHYTVALSDGFLRADPRPQIPGGGPPQFGGKDTVWSPEELLVASVLLCFKATLDAYARRESLEFHDWQGTGNGVLDKSKDGPIFTSIDLNVSLKVAAADVEKANKLLEVAKNNCIISNAIKAPVHYIASVTVG